MSVPRNENNQDNAVKNLINHRKDALKDSEARNIAIKMALDDTKSQDYLVNIINQGLVNKEEGRLANQQENEIIIDDEIEDNEFKFHKEFPNIYSQSDSVFDIGRKVPQNIKLTDTTKDKMKIRIGEQEVILKAIDEQNVEEVSNYDNTIS